MSSESRPISASETYWVMLQSAIENQLPCVTYTGMGRMRAASGNDLLTSVLAVCFTKVVQKGLHHSSRICARQIRAT